MKRLLLSFLLLSSVTLSAQYKSILSDTSIRWNIYSSNSSHFYAEEINSYGIGNSVTVNNIDYKEILIYNNYYFSGSNGYGTMGFVREDTLTGKAWFLYDTLSPIYEDIIYDLSLSKGDTFSISANSPTYFLVDTVYINPIDNRKYVKSHYLYSSNFYHFNFPLHSMSLYSDSLVFIEGIGSSLGFVNYNQFGIYTLFGGNSEYLTCVTRNSMTLYQGNLLSSMPIIGCDSITPGNSTGVNEHLVSDKIIITPNPTTGLIHLSGVQNLERVEVYDLSGKLMSVEFFSRDFGINSASSNSLSLRETSTEVFKGSNHQLNLSNYLPGIYLLKLILTDGSFQTVKVVKE